MKRNIFFLLCCLAFTLLAGPKAQWIARNEPLTQNSKRYYRYIFTLPNKTIKSALICYVFAGSANYMFANASSIYGNGTKSNMYPEYASANQPEYQYEIKRMLKVNAANVLAVEITDSPSSGRGLIAHLLITFSDNSTMEIVTDTNWESTTSVSSTDYHVWAAATYSGSTWSKVVSLGDYTSSQWMNYDMLPLFAKDAVAAEIERRKNIVDPMDIIMPKLEDEPAEESSIAYERGSAFFNIGGKLYRPVLYNCNDGWSNSEAFVSKLKNFTDTDKSDIKLITFGFEGDAFWTGQDKNGNNIYNYSAIDEAFEFFLKNTCYRDDEFYEEGFKTRFMVGYNFSHGPRWWNSKYPNETAKYARFDSSNEPGDCIGNYNIHSYASEQWRKDACDAIRAFVEYIESKPYGKHVFAYRIGEGVYSEWVYFGMDSAMPDVSVPMLNSFRKFLREKYGNDVTKLRAAWKQPSVTFDNALIPPVEVRLKYLNGTLRDPRDAWSIDFLKCLMDNQYTLLMEMNRTVKEACGYKKLVGNYFGYFYGIGYTAEGWYIENDKALASDYVDFQMSPCCYSSTFRSVGSSQLARSLAATYRVNNKINIFEADSRTHLCDDEQKGSRFANNLQESLATLSRDMAQCFANGAAYWYYDFGKYTWYNHPDIFKFFQKITPVFDAITDFSSSAEIAIIGDYESAYYHAIQDYDGGLSVYCACNNQTLELNKAGLIFDSYSFADIDKLDVDQYKIFIFPQLYYMTPEKLAKLNTLKKAGKTLIFMHASGWLTPDGPSEQSIVDTTGIGVKIINKAADDTTSIRSSLHGTNGLVMETSGYHAPVVQIDDSAATLLGKVTPRGASSVYGYAKKLIDNTWTSYVTSSPFITYKEWRAIANEAGVHSYCNGNSDGLVSGVVYANKSMIAFHTGTVGSYTLKAKEAVKWKMVYPDVESSFSSASKTHTFNASLKDTYIFVIEK